VSEAYRQIRTNLRYVNVDAPLHRILVTSAMPAEGKSTTVTNLALSIAETGATVVIVDADLRRPAVRRYLHLGQFRGLSTVLSGECTADQAIETYGDTSLQILAAGPIPPNPSELLSSDAMSRLLDELGRRYEYVIVDSPPTLPVSDAAILSGQVDGTLLICRQGTVKRRDVERVIAQLQQIGANLAGIILNDVRTRRGDDYSYYGTGYASHENVGTPGDADPVVAADDRNAPV
jgi:capsular exopolysaccharide synthesis family protein